MLQRLLKHRSTDLALVVLITVDYHGPHEWCRHRLACAIIQRREERVKDMCAHASQGWAAQTARRLAPDHGRDECDGSYEGACLSELFGRWFRWIVTLPADSFHGILAKMGAESRYANAV